MGSKKYGYARCSTKTQNLERQIKALVEFGVKEEYIFTDKESGKIPTEAREEYSVLRRCLDSGDTLVVDALDRLGRTKSIIKDELQYLKNKGIHIVILNIPTTTMDMPEGQEWVIEMVTNLLIEVYASVAESELVEKERRTRAGIAIAKEQGKYVGRQPVKFDHEKMQAIYPRWKRGDIKSYEFQQLLGLKPNTFYRAIQRLES